MGIGSLFGGFAQGALNYSSNQSTNRQNMQINQMNNAFNERMWEKEQAYNSPLEQMKRLQAAGINPAAAYSNGVDNTVSSSPSAASPIAMQAYQGNELAELGNRISLDKLRDIQGNESESRVRLNDSTVVVNYSTVAKNNKEIEAMNANIGLMGQKLMESKANVSYLESLKHYTDEQKAAKAIDNYINDALKNHKVLQGRLQTEKEKEALRLLIAKIANVNASTEKYEYDKAKIIQEIKESAARVEKLGKEATGLEIANMISSATMWQIIDKIGFEVKGAEIKVNMAQLEQFMEELRIGTEGNVVYQFLSSFFGLGGDFFGVAAPIQKVL